jgi:hypothetical protein
MASMNYFLIRIYLELFQGIIYIANGGRHVRMFHYLHDVDLFYAISCTSFFSLYSNDSWTMDWLFYGSLHYYSSINWRFTSVLYWTSLLILPRVGLYVSFLPLTYSRGKTSWHKGLPVVKTIYTYGFHELFLN